MLGTAGRLLDNQGKFRSLYLGEKKWSQRLANIFFFRFAGTVFMVENLKVSIWKWELEIVTWLALVKR